MRVAGDAELAARLRDGGRGVAARHGWDAARRHETGVRRSWRRALMALEVVATFRGGFATDVTAREHKDRVDEPATAGGTDSGMMPTEVFCAALASCFCLAVGSPRASATRRCRV